MSPFTWPGPSPVPTSTGPALPLTKQTEWTKKQRGSNQKSGDSRKKQHLTKKEHSTSAGQKTENTRLFSLLQPWLFISPPTLNMLLLGWEKHYSGLRTGAGGETQTGGHSSTPLGQLLRSSSSSLKAGPSQAKGPSGHEDPAGPNPPAQGIAQHPINAPAPLLAMRQPARPRPPQPAGLTTGSESSNRWAKPQNTRIFVPESITERQEK